VESGETPEEAIVREVREETGLGATVVRALFEEPYDHGICRCYLLTAREEDEANLGYDPEEAGLPLEQRMLQLIAWKPLPLMRDDRQVAQVLRALSAQR
jgi:8-oxo-dGTP pyrophosphatase MutT (NUDIX family)